jgi:predicted Rossmann fold flavoprotein
MDSHTPQPQPWDAVVIGGGPAGFFAALRCAELQPTYKILILEKTGQPLSKVRISGGGRCNLTHACFDPAVLVSYYPRGSRELRGAFTRFQPADTMSWFETRGVRLKTEADGRVFPASDSSDSIIDCLLEQAQRLGIRVCTNAPVLSVQRDEVHACFKVDFEAGESLRTRRLLLATGGTRRAYQFAQTLGHTLQPPVPSLFTFTISDPRLDGLAGVSVDEAVLRLPAFGIEQIGALLVTHWGLSGPAILKLSAWGARPLHAAGYQADLTINWLPGVSAGDLQGHFQEIKSQFPCRTVAAHAYPDQVATRQPLPGRLWKKLVSAAGIGPQQTWGDLSRRQLADLVCELTKGQYRISGKGAFKEEFVTCGGVSLKEVDFKTMQSRVCPGLYLAGELLDIDALTGGFNFQAAWTTGWLAGSAMAERESER